MANMDDHYRKVAEQKRPVSRRKKRSPIAFANEVMSRDYIVKQALQHGCRKCGAGAGAPCVSIAKGMENRVLKDVHGERAHDGMRAVQRPIPPR